MFSPIPATVRKKLWKHQRNALDFAVDHLNRTDSPCLIRMPTGTGKTGIIACLTMLSNRNSSLVLTPWAHLRNQMVSDLKKGFWDTIGTTPSKHEIVSIFPSNAETEVKSSEAQVIVATFTTLNDLRLNYSALYRELAGAISLVLVDEGHYEPAVEWGKSVKGLKTKTLLLTATPYRNDLKLFRITDSKRSTHHFTHAEAVKQGIIRNLAFGELVSTNDTLSLSTAFAAAWKKAKKDGNLPSRAPRAIVCCAGAGQIERTVAHLRKLGLKAIGVHEQFEKSPNGTLLRDVPDPRSTDSEIWVHQHKLTEGLDDNRFCCIALFTRIRNDRKLVQQIGRILRRNSADRKVAALLLAPAVFSAEDEWTAYLKFETNLKLLEPQHFRDVVDTLLKTQPEVEYFNGRFRRRFRPDRLSTETQVIIPPSVLVRRVGNDFSLDAYIEDCTDTLNTEDAVILGPNSNAPCLSSETSALWVYASVGNSRFLQNTSLYEVRLETHCVVLVDDLLFISDSEGNYPIEILEEKTGALEPDELTRYLDRSFRLTHATVDSSIPYDTVIRGAELRGHNLLNVATSLTDRLQICRAARGTSTKDGRRYIGMATGRLRKEISADSRRSFDVQAFVSWAESVAKILKSRVAESRLFRRYMQPCRPPADPKPKTICVDFLRLDAELTLADGTECSLKSSAADIRESAGHAKTTFSCEFRLEGKRLTEMSVTLRIDYQPSKRRFWFYKQDGASLRVHMEGDEAGEGKGLAEFLNLRQDIVLIGLDGGEMVYQGRNFYAIDYSFAETVLVNLIQRPHNAPRCRSEKGTHEQITALRNSAQTRFPVGSVFRAVADELIELPFHPEVLICDDLGTESADFIGADFGRHQMALIHAKAGSGRRISAAAFHDVAAQAMKNLVYLTRTTELPEGLVSWRRNVKWNRTNIPRLYRMPRGAPAGEQLWRKLRSDTIESSNPELFVILATTGCCDSNELKTAIKDRSKRTPEVAQLLHLLDGLNSYSRQLGVRLVIYDLPYQQP